MTKKSENKKPITQEYVQETLTDVFAMMFGSMLIEATKHNKELNKAVRKKVLTEVSKTKLYKEEITRLSKDN